MLRILKSFADVSLKVVAVRSADNSNFEFEFPASGRPSTPSPLMALLQPLPEHPRGLLVEILAWQHGGINE